MVFQTYIPLWSNYVFLSCLQLIYFTTNSMYGAIMMIKDPFTQAKELTNANVSGARNVMTQTTSAKQAKNIPRQRARNTWELGLSMSVFQFSQEQGLCEISLFKKQNWLSFKKKILQVVTHSVYLLCAGCQSIPLILESYFKCLTIAKKKKYRHAPLKLGEGISENLI